MTKACGFKRRRLFCKGKVIDRKFRYTYNIFCQRFLSEALWQKMRKFMIVRRIVRARGKERGVTPIGVTPQKAQCSWDFTSRNTSSAVPQTPCHDGLRRGPFVGLRPTGHARCRGNNESLGTALIDIIGFSTISVNH